MSSLLAAASLAVAQAATQELPECAVLLHALPAAPQQWGGKLHQQRQAQLPLLRMPRQQPPATRGSMPWQRVGLRHMLLG